MMPVFHWSMTLGNVAIVAALLGSSRAIVVALVGSARAVVMPIREHLEEHDILWEDYNERTGGHYRRRSGRGSPPEPSDYYREHRLSERKAEPEQI